MVFNSQCNNIHIHLTVQLTSRYNLEECACCGNIEPFVNTLSLLLRATREWKYVCLSCKCSLFKVCNILKSWYIKMSVHLYLLSVDRGFLSYLSTGSCASTAPISFIYCSEFSICDINWWILSAIISGYTNQYITLFVEDKDGLATICKWEKTLHCNSILPTGDFKSTVLISSYYLLSLPPTKTIGQHCIWISLLKIRTGAQ